MSDKIEITEEETDVSRRALMTRLGLVAVGSFVAPMALTVNEAHAGRKSKNRKHKKSKSSNKSKKSGSSKSSKSSGGSKSSKSSKSSGGSKSSKSSKSSGGSKCSCPPVIVD